MRKNYSHPTFFIVGVPPHDKLSLRLRAKDSTLPEGDIKDSQPLYSVPALLRIELADDSRTSEMGRGGIERIGDKDLQG